MSSSTRHVSPPKTAWFGGSMPFARFGLIVNLIVPFIILLWDAQHQMLGADPVNFATHTTGYLALLYLLLSLCVTPLRNVTGFTWLIQFRRSLGVYAFYYACAHLGIYFWFDRQRNLGSTVHEILTRNYLEIGFLSLALMAPLWATSFNAAIRALGGERWKRLHRLTYLAAICGCIHFYMQSKADKRKPEIFIAVLATLLAWRVAVAIGRRIRTAGAARFYKGDMRVTEMRPETPNVRTFRLGSPNGGALPFTFHAGQFLNLSLQIEGKKISRSYTIASPPTRDQYLEITIKREENGQVSRYLHDMLVTGQTVTISAPAGRFTFDSNSANQILLIAGGVGITPVMSILRELTDRNWPGQIDLLFSVRSQEEVIFADELQRLAARHANLHVHLTITRDAPAEWTGHRGRISVELLHLCVPDFNHRRTFICGPDEMAQATRAQLIAAGTSPEKITVESFTPSAAVATDDGKKPAEEFTTTAVITFAQSNQTATSSSNQSILELAESLGIHIDYDCRSGICGTCRCKLLAGQVTMKVKDALSTADELEGYILTCQAHATEDCTIDA